MAIKLHDLMKEERAVTFEYEGEQVAIRYRPAAITPQMQSVASRMQQLNARMEENNKLRKEGADELDPTASIEMGTVMVDFVSVIVTLCAFWDVLDEKGNPLPVTEALAMRMPINFLMSVFRAAMDDMRPNAGNAGN